VITSAVITAFFPDSVADIKAAVKAIEIAAEHNIKSVEVYCEEKDAAEMKETLNKYRLQSVFVGAYLQKKNGLRLCDENEERRSCAVSKVKECVKIASDIGAKSVLVIGGRRPDDEADRDACRNAFERSLSELCEYAETMSGKPLITVEPGDTDVDSCELLGPTADAVELAKALSAKGYKIGLTLDTSHMRQLGEDCRESLKKGVGYCDHLHLANCYLKDKTSKMYGDKHPPFDYEDGEIDPAYAKELYDLIKELYGDSVTVAQETRVFGTWDYQVSEFKRNMALTPWF